MRRASGGSTDVQARASALARRYLRFGVRSVAQVQTYLRAREVPPAVIEAVLVECRQRGWVDDRACAKLIAGRLAEQGYGVALIRARLAARELAPAAVEAALAPLASEGQELSRARAAARSRARTARAVAPGEAARLARRLARRGFSPEIIEQTITRHE
ncbi:MAG: RecX family transcriptional regulator [Candidatus Omnitrophica bacterium]|nr:RecX family transcriptional regulator [Candidatus Omnitrophota bacterium]